MKKRLATDEVIEDLVSATLGVDAGARAQHVLRENLRVLVRLAKAEQMTEIKANVQRLAGMMEAQSARRHAKALLLAHQLPDLIQQMQQQFEFKQ
jgi:hypothetical protein